MGHLQVSFDFGSEGFRQQFAPVAQLDRVIGFEPIGRGFESLRAHHLFDW